MSSAAAKWVPTQSIQEGESISANLLTSAFSKDPLYKLLTSDDLLYDSFARFIFSKRIEKSGEKSLVLIGNPSANVGVDFKIQGNIYSTYATKAPQNGTIPTRDHSCDSPTILGHCILTPPEDKSIKFDAWTKFRLGFWQIPFRFGFKLSNRFDEALGIMMPHLAQVRASDHELTRNVWGIEAMGINPSLQGQGLGGKAMKAILEVIDEDGRPALVMTQKKANVRFYERYGFEIVGHKEISLGDQTIGNWVMKRPGTKSRVKTESDDQR